MKYAPILVPLVLAGCMGKTTVPFETQYKTVTVEVPAPCPALVVAQSLLDDRPVPLRLQPKPDDATVRSAKSQAQLGKYEAEGGWADRVVAALKRCQLP